MTNAEKYNIDNNFIKDMCNLVDIWLKGDPYKEHSYEYCLLRWIESEVKEDDKCR